MFFSGEGFPPPWHYKQRSYQAISFLYSTGKSLYMFWPLKNQLFQISFLCNTKATSPRETFLGCQYCFNCLGSYSHPSTQLEERKLHNYPSPLLDLSYYLNRKRTSDTSQKPSHHQYSEGRQNFTNTTMAFPLIPTIAILLTLTSATYKFLIQPLFISPLSRIPSAQ